MTENDKSARTSFFRNRFSVNTDRQGTLKFPRHCQNQQLIVAMCARRIQNYCLYYLYKPIFAMYVFR